jgi:hypothetical protein
VRLPPTPRLRTRLFAAELLLSLFAVVGPDARHRFPKPKYDDDGGAAAAAVRRSAEGEDEEAQGGCHHVGNGQIWALGAVSLKQQAARLVWQAKAFACTLVALDAHADCAQIFIETTTQSLTELCYTYILSCILGYSNCCSCAALLCIADFLVSHLQPLIDVGYKLTTGSAESLHTVFLAFQSSAPALQCIADFLVSDQQPLIDLGYKLTTGLHCF